MLYHFLVPLAKQFRVLNVFNYISFRAVGAAVTALLLSFIVGPIILRALKNQSVHQVVREGTPRLARRQGHDADDGRLDHPQQLAHLDRCSGGGSVSAIRIC